MRIAIHNHYAGQEVAETEFSKRICYAASNLGWETVEVGFSSEIKQFDPDFVIALHFRTPKLTKYPTYGSMVSPPAYFAHEDQFLKNILSYDGYLTSSDRISSWLKDILYQTNKKHFIAPWYTTSHLVTYCPPQIGAPRLFYAGTNWDGPRFKEVFARLDAESYFDIYGPQTAWSHVRNSYRGSLPFDGVSILNTLNAAGVGLCLHREEHCEAGTPSSRIFEIAASGAVAICQEHPFIRDAFQDSVLYLECTADAARLTEQISKYMKWIAQNPEEALKLSRRAYDLFAQNYTLEKLLTDLVVHHKELVRRKKFTPNAFPKTLGDKSAQLIIRIGDRGTRYLERALASISCQSYSRVGAIIVQYKEVPNLSRVLDKYNDRLPIQVVPSSYTGFRSTQLWDGLRAVSAEYFGILDDDDAIHPNHVNLLVQLLDQFKDCGVAYSGSIRIWESDPTSGPSAELPAEPAELMYFEPFDLGRLVTMDNFITSNAFVARSSLLDNLGNDPQLPLWEDLFLLLFLCRKTNFIFTYEATCEFCWRGNKTDNSVLMGRPNWAAARKRIENLLWKEGFHSTQQIGRSSLSQLEIRGVHLEAREVQLEAREIQLETKAIELERRLNEIENILTQTKARADALTLRLDRYLDSPILNVIRRVRRKLLRLPPPEA